MERVENTSTEFLCAKTEKVTIVIAEKNTEFLVECVPQNDEIVFVGKIISIDINGSTKSVALTFDFDGAGGGSYQLALTGSKGGSFKRGAIQPSDDLPTVKTYTFHTK